MDVILSSSTKTPEKAHKMPTQQDRRTFIVGILLLLIVVLLWTGSSFLTQGLFDEGYEKPFLITYLNTSAFSLYLLPFIFRIWRGQASEDDDASRGEYEAIPTDASNLVSTPYRSRSLPRSVRNLEPQVLPPLTTKETAKLASVFCFFWFIANWAVNASLDYTSVASSTILSSMSGFFTLLVGRVFSVEVFTLGKLGAVITSFFGVLLVSLADSTKDSSLANPTGPQNRLLVYHPSPDVVNAHPASSNPLLGDSLALISALFYALYVTLLKVRVHTESRIDMQLFFGFVGLFNILTLWPLGMLLHYTGVEKAEWPSTQQAWIVVGINMLITFSSDYIYLLAMLKTTPLIVTIGLSLTIPLAVFGDYFWLGGGVQPQRLIGAALVLFSFVAVGIEGSQEVNENNTPPLGTTMDAEDQDVIAELLGNAYGSTGRSRGRSFTRPRPSVEADDSVSISLGTSISREGLQHVPGDLSQPEEGSTYLKLPTESYRTSSMST